MLMRDQLALFYDKSEWEKCSIYICFILQSIGLYVILILVEVYLRDKKNFGFDEPKTWSMDYTIYSSSIAENPLCVLKKKNQIDMQ